MRGPKAMSLLQRAVGESSIHAQNHARDNLQSMVYDQPSSVSGYIRTKTLLRGMSAFKSSRPNTGQHAKAAAGVDLKATDPMEVVERRANEFRTSVGNPVSYAEYVIAGTFQPDQSARDFMEGVDDEFQDSLQEHVDDAWRQIGNL